MSGRAAPGRRRSPSRASPRSSAPFVALRDVTLGHRARRVRLLPRPERLRQDHAAADHRGARAPERGGRPHGRPRRLRRCRPRSATTASSSSRTRCSRTSRSRRNVAYGLETRRAAPRAEIDAPRRRAPGPGRARRTTRTSTRAALGRRAAARRAGPRARARRPRCSCSTSRCPRSTRGCASRLRHEIRGLQRRLGVTTIMVTHDQEEALAMADRIVVMNHGAVEQVGAPIEVYTRPALALRGALRRADELPRGHARARARAGCAWARRRCSPRGRRRRSRRATPADARDPARGDPGRARARATAREPAAHAHPRRPVPRALHPAEPGPGARAPTPSLECDVAATAFAEPGRRARAPSWRSRSDPRRSASSRPRPERHGPRSRAALAGGDPRPHRPPPAGRRGPRSATRSSPLFAARPRTSSCSTRCGQRALAEPARQRRRASWARPTTRATSARPPSPRRSPTASLVSAGLHGHHGGPGLRLRLRASRGRGCPGRGCSGSWPCCRSSRRRWCRRSPSSTSSATTASSRATTGLNVGIYGAKGIMLRRGVLLLPPRAAHPDGRALRHRRAALRRGADARGLAAQDLPDRDAARGEVRAGERVLRGLHPRHHRLRRAQGHRRQVLGDGHRDLQPGLRASRTSPWGRRSRWCC